jgi:glycine/D-amino acid oxidase-like deaminating enzyme
MYQNIAIVGNGSLGMYTAIQIKMTYPNASVHIFGNKNRKYAASTAAGAMANVYAEMEHSTGYVDEVNKRYLEMGKFGSRAWRIFLQETGGLDCITSEDTYIFLQNQASEFEKANFEAVRKSALHDNVLRDLTQEDFEQAFPSQAKNSIEKAIKIEGEFTFSVKKLFMHLDSVATSLGIVFEDIDVDAIEQGTQEITVAGNRKKFEKIVVAAGVKSHKIVGDDSLIPMYQGVGVAMLLNPIKDMEALKLRKGVFRSVNRGGAQCGIHLVPREDGKFYLGAGNYVSKIEDPVIRLDTIRYLLTTLENDLIGRASAYELTGEFVIGLRPRTLDGFPAIGSMKKNENIFIATGTNRAGLTWAPFVASQVLMWLQNDKLSDLIHGWHPDRSPIMFGTTTQGINYFVESRISNSKEHGLIEKMPSPEILASKTREFENAARIMSEQVSKTLGLPDGLTINPDNWSAVLSDL